MRRILLTVAYDGTNYFGWQKQNKPFLDTVEHRVEFAIRKFFKQPNLTCIGASRTDRGVHALGQRITFDVESTVPADRIPIAIARYLPDDIVIVKGEDVPMDFHPRFDCVKKTYEYHIINQKFRNPLERLYGAFIYEELDVDKMNKASKKFIGEKDFKAFCTDGSDFENTVRNVLDCSAERVGNKIIITVTGVGFLYHMVRTISGTLIGIGNGKVDIDSIEETFKSRDRQNAFYTAEPQGLVLKEIFYDL